MAGYESQIREIFLSKPECIINLPDWMLPKDYIESLRNIKGLAIVEMAGRDSVAAAIKGVEENNLSDLLPTYVYTGTEFGNWQSVIEAIERLRQKLPEGVRVHDLIVFGSTGFWQALNGRFISEMTKKFGFYTPCIGCHLYLHSTRIPLSVLLGNIPIIAGERESHDGGEKINQIPEVLDEYKSLFRKYKIPLYMPIRQIDDGKQIEKIIGIDWKQDKDQLGCVLSGNYRDTAGTNIIKKKDAINFLKNFLVPCTEKIIESYLDDFIPDHKKIAGELLDTQY
ncbi:MAG: hypothetical protein PVG39_19660 [Desulfobacteraceae bacterium]|jgi:hypothetical protein